MDEEADENNTRYVWNEEGVVPKISTQNNPRCHIRTDTATKASPPPCGLFFYSGITTSDWKKMYHPLLICINQLQILAALALVIWNTQMLIFPEFLKIHFLVHFNGNPADVQKEEGNSDEFLIWRMKDTSASQIWHEINEKNKWLLGHMVDSAN